MGIGLLAAAGPRADGAGFGQRLNEAMAQMDAFEQRKAQTEWLNMERARKQKEWGQADAAAEQAAAQKALEQRFFFGGGGLSGAGAVGGTSAPAVQGAGAIPASGAAADAPGSRIDAWSKQLGIPRDAIIADYLKNGGKGIAEMLFKRGTPDMQVTNGYAYDKNNIGPGFMPSLQTSQDGKSTMTRIGQDGLPVVSAPQGAMETYSGYQGTQAAFKPIKVYNPATGREEYTNERNVVQQAGGGAGGSRPAVGPQYTGPGYAGGSAQAAKAEQLRIMQSELDKLPQNHRDRPAIEREMQRLGGSPSQSGAYAAGPSASETAAAAAAQAKAVGTANADVERDSEGIKKVRSATENMTNADRAIELLQLGPTGSAIGALVDKGAAVVGRSTPGGNIAAQLDIVSANMVKNVPRFEGPQSNIDVDGYKAAAGRVSDRSLPIEQRIAAAKEVKYFEEKAIRQAQGGQSGGASGSWGDASALPANPSPKNLVKGQRYDLPNGKVGTWDGMGFKVK